MQENPQPWLRIGLSCRGVENRLESPLHCGLVHEKEQILADSTIPFDDSEIALAALRDLGYGGVS
jgi:hypothetical protein